MIQNIMVGLAFAAIIFVAFQKARSGMKNGKCGCGSTCGSSCSHKDICSKP